MAGIGDVFGALKFGGMTSQISSTIKLFLILGGAVLVFALLRKRIASWAQYKEYQIMILKKDAFGNTMKYYDRGGIFFDPISKNKLLYLLKNKVGLDPDNMPVIYSMKAGLIGSSLVKEVWLRQDGIKNFRFIKPELYPLDLYPDGRVDLVVGEPDLNWAFNELDRKVQLYKKESIWSKLSQFALPALGAGVFLVVMILLVQKFEVVQNAAASLNSAGAAMQRASENITASCGGTKILK